MNKYILIFLLGTFLGCQRKAYQEDLEKQWLVQRGELEKLVHEQQYEQAFTLANKRLAIAREHFADDFRLSNAYNDLGALYLDTDDYSKAEEYLKKALTIKNTEGKNLAVIYGNLGIYYNCLYQIELAHQYLTKAMNEYHKEKQLDTMAISYVKLGMAQIFSLKKQYEQSRQLLSEVLNYGIAKKDTTLINKALIQKGLLHFMESDYPSALKVYAELSDYYQRKDKPLKYADNLNYIASTLIYQLEFDKAIDSLQKATLIKLAIYKDSSRVSTEMKNIALVYDYKKDSVRAKEYRSISEKFKK